MEIKLFTNVYEDAHEKRLKYFLLKINGKIIVYSVFPENMEEVHEGVFRHEQRRFSYSYDDSFLTIFPDLKLNTKIKIFHWSIQGYEDIDGIEIVDEADIAGIEGYCYLNFWQRLVLDYQFKKLWIQKEENLKWIIGSLIALAAVFVSLATIFS